MPRAISPSDADIYGLLHFHASQQKPQVASRLRRRDEISFLGCRRCHITMPADDDADVII